MWTLEAFHMRCLRQLLNITWRDLIIKEAILATTGLTPLQDILSKRSPGVTVWPCRPTQMFLNIRALRMQPDLWTGRKPDVGWRRTSGRPRETWCCQIWTECHLVTTGTPVSSVATVEWSNVTVHKGFAMIMVQENCNVKRYYHKVDFSCFIKYFKQFHKHCTVLALLCYFYVFTY